VDAQPRPSGLVASIDDPALVHLSWQAPTTSNPVVAYQVLRGGNIVATLDGGALNYDDGEAPAGPAPTAPTVSASQGTRDDVELNWTVAVGTPGTAQLYSIVARYSEGDSAQSEPALGYRGAANINGYEVSINSGVTWLDAGTTSSWTDFSAPRSQATLTVQGESCA
jgi:hypothetical protein